MATIILQHHATTDLPPSCTLGSGHGSVEAMRLMAAWESVKIVPLAGGGQR